MNNQRMPKEIKERWLAALRSGTYYQGAGALCTQYYQDAATYCCLGVLVHVLDPKSPDLHEFGLPRKNFLERFGIHAVSIDAEGCRMSFRVQHEDGMPVAVHVLNDQGVPFSKIADLLDQAVEGV